MFARKSLALAAVVALSACGPKVSSLEVSTKNVTLTKKGEVAKLQIVAKDAQGKAIENVQLNFTSTAPEVAAVDAMTGAVTAMKTGDATVKVAFGEKINADVPVKVTIPAALTVAPGEVKLGVGEKVAVMARVMDEKGRDVVGAQIAWATDNAEIAAVEKGVITGVAAGAAKITATSGALKGEATVAIAAPIAKIEVKALSLNLKKTPEGKLAPVAKDEKGNNIENATFAFTVADANIAAIDAATGAVKALKKGKTKITVAAGDKTATAEVTVK